ncbi:MAG TPA: hypothetical protein VLX92_14375, partial [Kofleriaceae bacterium]|nr:hypothetical protein [Kofleriaceae bacterium]
MRIRHLALALAGIAVVVLGVYLFIEVRAAPAPTAPTAAARPERVERPERHPIAATAPAPALADTPHPAAPAEPEERVLPPAPHPFRHEPGAATFEHGETSDQVKLMAVMDQANKAYDRAVAGEQDY